MKILRRPRDERMASRSKRVRRGRVGTGCSVGSHTLGFFSDGRTRTRNFIISVGRLAYPAGLFQLGPVQCLMLKYTNHVLSDHTRALDLARILECEPAKRRDICRDVSAKKDVMCGHMW